MEGGSLFKTVIIYCSRSNVEDSPNVVQASERSVKGLDPKYLKPSEDSKGKKKGIFIIYNVNVVANSFI